MARFGPISGGNPSADALLALGVRFWYRRALLSLGSVAGFWRFGEPSGVTAVDEMAANNGTYVNAPTLGVAGLLAGDLSTAVTLNGSSQLITVTPAVALVQDTFTIIGWVKRGAAGAGSQQLAGIANGLMFGFYSDYLVFGKDGIGGGICTSGLPYPDTTSKHMIAVTRQGGVPSVSQLYFDGLPVGTNANTDALHTLVWPNGVPIGIGAHPYPAFFFNGTVKDVSLSTRPLASTEIAMLWRIGSGT